MRTKLKSVWKCKASHNVIFSTRNMINIIVIPLYGDRWLLDLFIMVITNAVTHRIPETNKYYT